MSTVKNFSLIYKKKLIMKVKELTELNDTEVELYINISLLLVKLQKICRHKKKFRPSSPQFVQSLIRE